MSETLDRIDRQILALLQRNARISNAELAQRVNLSPTPCLRRLRKLDKNTRHNGEVFEQALLELPAVTECCVVTGAHDYVLRVVSKSLEDYQRFLKEELAAVEVVADLESLIILNRSISRNELPL